MTPKLSVLVVSHNQKEVLPRCLDSILRQKLRDPFEVVISDDRSTDGTWDVIIEYCHKYPDVVRGIHCNSDECHPVHISERCGWNKLNAFLHSKGEFFVNIDADDYLISSDIYQHQLDLLESHPTCSMCMQGIRVVRDSQALSDGPILPGVDYLTEGMVLTPYDLILNRCITLNQAYLIRKKTDSDPKTLYGRLYDDTVITYHNLQYGDVVFTERADYAWVKHEGSITDCLIKDNLLVINAILPVCHSLLIPKFAGLFMSEDRPELFSLIKVILHRELVLNEENRKYLKQFNGFVFRCCEKRPTSLAGKSRLWAAFLLIGICRTFHIISPHISRLLFSLLTSEQQQKLINKSYWTTKPGTTSQ